MKMGATYFPLRWESTGDQWWYASPIDFAAANGHYDLVRELLRLDSNHLIKLTSLRRIRRLETVWDDDDDQDGHSFHGVAKCRSRVARHLFHECRHPNPAKNSLIRAGYGGWLMYTAASAGDLAFVRELLERYPLLVFGEGEYGATDILYAAARSKSCEVFRLLLDFAMSPRFMGDGGEVEERIGEGGSSLCVFKWEMMNRAVHAAARGGNLQILKQLLAASSSSHVLAYRDAHGSTVLHAAASRGQVQVVRDLIARFDMIESKDNEGNTALHIAAYKGQPAVVEALVAASPSLVSSKNNAGETFLHATVSGFLSSAFRRLDRQTELMRQLVSSPDAVAPVVNAKNSDGRTALHTAIVGNVHSDLVELLMTAPAIDVNVRDAHGMTPLDLLKTRPRSASSEILIRQLVSAGGVFGRHDYSTRRAMVSHLKMQGNGNSPGTRFGVSDTEIFLYTGINIGRECSEAERHSSASVTAQKQKLASSVNQRLKRALHWPLRAREAAAAAGALLEEPPTPLRQRFSSSRPSPLPSNKRTLSVRSNASSPLAKKKFASGIVHGVMQAMAVHNGRGHGHSKSLSKSSFSSSGSLEKQKGVMCVPREEAAAASCSKQLGDDVPNLGGSLRRLRNQYLCFGSQGLTVKLPESHRRSCVAAA